MFEFIGSGSAFNTKLGNNCACIRNKDAMLLIDCGSATFSRLHKYNIFEQTRKISVIITHTHPDHIGSLGELIFYAYYILKEKIKVFTPEPERIKSLLSYFGVHPEQYQLCEMQGAESIAIGDLLIDATPVPVSHVSSFNSFGYIFKAAGKTVYYSGDSNDISDSILHKLENGEIDIFYQDTCSRDYEHNPHLSLGKLCQLVKQEYRNKVHCMHLDENTEIQEIHGLGFNTVSNAFE